MAAHLHEYEFVFRTDVKGYYARINHDIIFNLVRQYVRDPVVLDLVRQYLKRFVSDGGEYTDIEQGISLGSPLSPLMGALYLKPLDDRMAELGCFYVRYMDDWVILAPTRWKLRNAIKAVNGVMADLRVEKHPDKTFIGRISRGFDFLGSWFSPSGLGVALKTVERCAGVGFPALRAKCVGWAHWGLCAAVVEVGEEWGGWGFDLRRAERGCWVLLPDAVGELFLHL